MTTKQYLSRAFNVDRKIKCKIEQIEEMNALATKVTSVLNDIKVQTSVDDHKTENIIIKILEYQDELGKDIEKLIKVKEETKKAIDSVGNDEYRQILEMRYLLYKRWEEIAVAMDYSIDNIYYIHRAALSQVIVPETSD